MLNIPEYKSAERVFHYFEEISKIPHGSGETDRIADYLVSFANERGLFVKRDAANNVIICGSCARKWKTLCPIPSRWTWISTREITGTRQNNSVF